MSGRPERVSGEAQKSPLSGDFRCACSQGIPVPQISFEPGFGAYQTEFGAENKSALFQDFLLVSAVWKGSRAISKPAPNIGTHQTPVETLSEYQTLSS